MSKANTFMKPIHIEDSLDIYFIRQTLDLI